MRPKRIKYDDSTRTVHDALIVKKSLLLCLPRELRDGIYRNIFTIDEQSHPAWTVLRINRQIRAEALAVFEQQVRLVKVRLDVAERHRLRRPHDVRVLGFDPFGPGEGLGAACSHPRVKPTRRYPYHILEVELDFCKGVSDRSASLGQTCLIIDLESLGELLFNTTCHYLFGQMLVTLNQPFDKQHMHRNQSAIWRAFQDFAKMKCQPTVIGFYGELPATFSKMLTAPLSSRIGTPPLELLKNLIHDSKTLQGKHEWEHAYTKLLVVVHWMKIFQREITASDRSMYRGVIDYIESEFVTVHLQMAEVAMEILMQTHDPSAETRNRYGEPKELLQRIRISPYELAPHEYAAFHFHCARLGSMMSGADLGMAIAHIDVIGSYSEAIGHERSTLKLVQSTLDCFNGLFEGGTLEWPDGNGKQIGDSSWIFSWHSNSRSWVVRRCLIRGLWGVGISTEGNLKPVLALDIAAEVTHKGPLCDSKPRPTMVA